MYILYTCDIQYTCIMIVQPAYTTLYLPGNKKVNISGECDGSEPELTLTWENNTSLQMTFERVSV